MKDIHIVKCPHCNYEYSAAELLVPNALLERPYYIKRDSSGKIQGALGSSGCLTDTYTCDCCEKDFEIEVLVDFRTKKLEKFQEVSTLKL